MRLDLNESLDKSGKLLDDFRVKASIPTIKSLVKSGAKIIILSHLGRPEGKPTKSLSLKPVAESLATSLKYKLVTTSDRLPSYGVPHLVFFTGDITKSEVRQQLAEQSGRDIIILENIRFYEGEESNDRKFAKELSELGDIYVNDAFGVCHRAAASTAAITEFLPSYAGPLLAKEISALDVLLSGRAQKPFVLMVGGIKISDKAQTLMNLGRRVDQILIGGGLANLFLHAKGYDVGVKHLDKSSVQLAKQILLNLKNKIVLPTDVTVYSAHKRSGSPITTKLLPKITSTDKVYDIGTETILTYTNILKKAGTVCWNGPMGYFEEKPYRAGTLSLAKVAGAVGRRKAYVVAGGGETVAAIRQSGQFDHYDHISTGGGAMLEYLAGAKLPGIEALK